LASRRAGNFLVKGRTKERRERVLERERIEREENVEK